MKSLSIAIFCMIIVIVISCKKSEEEEPILRQYPPINQSDLTECHTKESWDSTEVHTKLIGKWDWEYYQCFWNTENGNGDAFKGLTVEFNADNTLEMRQNGEITQNATWKIAELNDGYFSLNVNPLVVHLPGRIFICDDRVVFMDSYVDGCDNYFIQSL